MSKREFTISAIFTAHREGMLAAKSLVNFFECIDYSVSNGFDIEAIICADRPDKLTKEIVEMYSRRAKILTLDYGDQGLVRNEAIKVSQGEYIAFLDGDDFWSYNWLVESMNVAKASKNFIVHPAYNWFFEGSNGILKKVDQESTVFDKRFLRAGNYWDALCLCHRSIYEVCPFTKRDMENGFAYEDWHWNCETLTRGFIHKVAQNTIHFKRRRTGSQTMKASQRAVLMRKTELISYKEGLD
ncbi:glycosyltransferase family 2 protein [Aestuariibacter salexigens]|uniref:glycosyltransferase family 2 protein n=1 Tax=Aestuariibacter salexigens TaxID=226010 RepID=UPI00041897A9|nr:glycosyltransferase family 2 protein [Aestuariibacter salexigens]